MYLILQANIAFPCFGNIPWRAQYAEESRSSPAFTGMVNRKAWRLRRQEVSGYYKYAVTEGKQRRDNHQDRVTANQTTMPRGDVYDGQLLDKFLFKGRVIVITGGGRGLGLAFANGLAQAGANIAVIDIAEQPSPVFSGLSAFGGKYKYYKSDVTDYERLKATIDQISEDFGSIDGWYEMKIGFLTCNAGKLTVFVTIV